MPHCIHRHTSASSVRKSPQCGSNLCRQLLQPARNMAKNAVSGVRPEEEPQGSIWFLTQAILLFPQHPPAMDNSSQQEDRIPTSAKHASMCLRPSHAKKIGIGCADKPPVRLKSFNVYRMDRDMEQLIS